MQEPQNVLFGIMTYKLIFSLFFKVCASSEALLQNQNQSNRNNCPSLTGQKGEPHSGAFDSTSPHKYKLRNKFLLKQLYAKSDILQL